MPELEKVLGVLFFYGKILLRKSMEKFGEKF